MLDFHVGVNILAVFELTEVSIPGLFKIGAGRDELRRLPFSSSTVGGCERLPIMTCSLLPPRIATDPSDPEASESSWSPARSTRRGGKCPSGGMILLERGDDFGVVLIMLPSEILANKDAMVLPLIVVLKCSLPHILQKKFSNLWPTSFARTFLFVA